MPSAAVRSPTPLDELRRQSQESLANLRPSEYSIRTWINIARVAFESADRAWKAGRSNADGHKVAEAFLEYKKAAGCLHLATHHPDYPDLARSSSLDYRAIVELLQTAKEARQSNQDVVEWLERREAMRNRQHPNGSRNLTMSVGSSGSENGGVRPEAGSNHPQASSSAPHRPGPVKTPSFPTTTLAERMAALRASGLSSTSIPSLAGHSMTQVPRASTPSTSSFAAPSSPKRSATPTLPASSPRSVVSALPPSPPTSPPTKKGDLAADDAAGRSGSAPPVLPYSNIQEAATAWTAGMEGLQFRQEGGAPIAKRANGVLDRGPAGGVSLAPEARMPHSDLSDMSTPSTFGSSFPSLDDFEQRVDGSSTSAAAATLPHFPSVPTIEPSSLASSVKHSRPPPPRPPKPSHVDASTFERQQLERADALAKVAAGHEPDATTARSPASPRTGLPAALVPGATPPTTKPSPMVPLPPPSASTQRFPIPFSTEVRPRELFQYFQTHQAERGQGPRVLLLDVRSRDEYERARIRGETVCLEPVSLRHGIKSSDIENSLSLAPPHEAQLFAARHHYDMVVIYDRSSTTIPTAAPPSSASEAQRVLWNLGTAIYEREFSKALKRQPVLLRGGWDAWESQVGLDGVVGRGASEATARLRSVPEDATSAEAKRTNRRAAVLPSDVRGRGTVLRNEREAASSATAQTSRAEAAYRPGPASLNHAASNGVNSHRLAMPPVAAQRSGPAPAYDPFAAPPHASRPPYTQPHFEGYSLPTSTSTSPAIPRTRSDVPDLYAASQSRPSPYANGDYTRSSFDYARPSIDYPQLQSRPSPSTVQASRPPPAPSYSAVPPVPLARPPPVKPAPIRSNSSFSSLQLAQYTSAHSQFPTLISFDEGIIGLSGLKNLGNTCYMNSTIQCLSAAIPFAKYFTGGVYRKDVNTVNPLGSKGALANAVAELIRALWAQQYNFLSPVTFREQICRVAPQFRGSDQHDAQEFLGFLLDGLHEDCNYVVKKPPPIEMTPEREHDLETLPPQLMSEREWSIYKMRNDSFIVRCFQGQFRNQLRCLTCDKTSTTYNTFMPLSVPIPAGRGISRVSLVACLENFVRDEILDKDDAWFCPRCKKNRKAVKKLSLSKLPPILVIHLKRFSFHGPFSDKIETQVQYPLTGLDLNAFVPPPLMDQRGKAVNEAPPKGYSYDLFGVTNHYGNLSSGHYTAFVRSGREWFNIGDSKVTPCDPGVVHSAKSAYILYYAMRT
ncbi:hypothetical protein JCM11641_006697 [Rhodosporidiobolus odoratus]